jgi:hypothetical protein
VRNARAAALVSDERRADVGDADRLWRPVFSVVAGNSTSRNRRGTVVVTDHECATVEEDRRQKQRSLDSGETAEQEPKRVAREEDGNPERDESERVDTP